MAAKTIVIDNEPGDRYNEQVRVGWAFELARPIQIASFVKAWVLDKSIG